MYIFCTTLKILWQEHVIVKNLFFFWFIFACYELLTEVHWIE